MSVWPRGSEADSPSHPLPPSPFPLRSVLVVPCVCLLLAVGCFPLPVVLSVWFRSCFVVRPTAAGRHRPSNGWLKRISGNRAAARRQLRRRPRCCAPLSAAGADRVVCRLVAGGVCWLARCWLAGECRLKGAATSSSLKAPGTREREKWKAQWSRMAIRPRGSNRSSGQKLVLWNRDRGQQKGQ